ncbi:hypothetical protein JTB14_023828 [Gonioctena quinquepunctata]|nr:hypothetical protein JTB14_023828 [Gonioctena quinquepunctata]
MRDESVTKSVIGRGERSRQRIAGGANGIFTRRLDFSSFNALPKNKLNSYQIKVAGIFNERHHDLASISRDTVTKINRLFARTGAVFKTKDGTI